MFELEQFIGDCRVAVRDNSSYKAVREVGARAVSDPAAVLNGLGEAKRAEIQTLYRSDELTVPNVIWGPHMNLLPHNHQMWAVIGIYSGREDNIFWRRLPESAGGKVEAAGARALCEKDAMPAGARYYPFRYEPDCPFDRSDPRLRRRLFRRAAQRMGSGDAPGRALRCRENSAAIPGIQPDLRKDLSGGTTGSVVNGSNAGSRGMR